MSEDKKILLEIKMWLEDTKTVGTKYVLPHVTDETMVDFYRLFFHKLCEEIAKVPGAENLIGLLTGITEEKDDDRLE
jgi:hypothetical protein